MIIIMKKTITLDFNGQPVARAVSIYITDGATAFTYDVGGLPLTGSLQTALNEMEAELWPEAQANGAVATETDREIVNAIQWYISNPGTKVAVFDKTVAQEVTDITALIAASFPSASAAVKTGWLQLLMSALLDTRVNAHDRDLV